MNKNINLKSRTYYSSITGVEFSQKEKRDITLKLLYKKGDSIVKRRLFGKPTIEYAETDLYEDEWCDYDGTSHKSMISPRAYARRYGLKYNNEANEVYRPAKVTIIFNGGSHETFNFDNDEVALEFINDLKEKCKKCNNELI